MTPSTLITTAQVTWLVLCGMMIFSRFVFHGAGAAGMRRFLDTWKTSRTHRVWGWVAFLYGLGLFAVMLMYPGDLGFIDLIVVGSVVVILTADGLLNLFPAWFGHFKERMQNAWVKRQGGGKRSSDHHLFGTVNILLGAASLAVAVPVALYRPLPLPMVGLAAFLSVALTLLLVRLCRMEMGEEESAEGG